MSTMSRVSAHPFFQATQAALLRPLILAAGLFVLGAVGLLGARLAGSTVFASITMMDWLVMFIMLYPLMSIATLALYIRGGTPLLRKSNRQLYRKRGALAALGGFLLGAVLLLVAVLGGFLAVMATYDLLGRLFS